MSQPESQRAVNAAIRALAICAVAFTPLACSSPTRQPELGADPALSPIASPAEVRQGSVSRAVFGLRPVGVVPFAGPMLPLASPGAEFLAVPQGEPAPWPAVLAEPGAAANPLSRIRVYSLKGRSAVELTWSDSLPRGLVLGRSCDERGFLVEAPQADGSRWIGKVAWSDGHLDWLVRDKAVCAHAALGPDSQLVYTSRPIASPVTEIVVRSPAGATARIPAPAGTAFFSPWFSGTQIAALLRSPDAIELVRLAPTPVNGAASFIHRRTLARGESSSGFAFQMLASLQLTRAGSLETAVAVFDPSTQGMVPVIDSGPPEALEQHSVAAVRTAGRLGDGWLLTTPDGLVFRPQASIDAKRQDRVRISDKSYLPRLTSDPGRFLLLGPNPGGVAPSIQILMLETAPDRTEPEREPETGAGI